MKPPCCPRCQSFYSIRFKSEHGRHERGPLLLPCGHTFCEICLKKLITPPDDTISCPTCQMQATVGGRNAMHKHLHPDVYIVGLLTAKHMELDIQSQKLAGHLAEKTTGGRKREPKVADCAIKAGAFCSECQVNSATCQCTKCDCIMCRPCFDKVHKMSYSLKKHQAVPYTPESEERSVVKMSRSRICSSHDQCHIEYFCKDDNKTVCSRCVIMGDHKGHNVQTMEDKNKEALSEMEPAIQLAQEVIWRLGKAEKMLKDATPVTKVDTRGLIDEVRDHFTQLHSLLQAREEQLLDEIREESLTAANPIQELKSYLTEEKLKLEAAIIDGVRAMHGNVHRLIDADLIIQRLKHAKDVTCVVTPRGSAPESALKFSHDQASLQATIASYGSLVSSSLSHMFFLSLPSPDAEKPPPEVLHIPSVEDGDNMSTTDTESITDSVVLEDEKEESLAADMVDIKLPENPALKKLTIGHSEKVMVTHIRTPAEFYVQLQSRAGELQSMSLSISNYCRGTAAKRDIPESINEGDMVLAQYARDKVWYRARVFKVDDSKNSESDAISIEVLFIDYGNSEVTTLQKIRTIPKRFLKSAAFALQCSLFDIVPYNEDEGWSLESVNTMFEMTSGKPMIMMVENNVGGVLEVDLSRPENDRSCLDARPVSVRDSLVFLELAVFHIGSHLSSSRSHHSKRDYVTLRRMPPGAVVDVRINCVQSPSLFYSQLYGDKGADYLLHLLKNMQKMYREETRNLYTVYCPRKGMICAARNSKDGNWYRARVTGLLGGRKVEVQFVDYGNKDVIGHTAIRKILDDFIKCPAQAIECSLIDVEPADESGQWSEEAVSWFSKNVTQRVCQFRVSKESCRPNVMEGALYAINADDNSLCCLNMELVRRGFARSTGQWSQVENFEGVTLKMYDQLFPELVEDDFAVAASAPHMHCALRAQPYQPSAASSGSCSLSPGSSTLSHSSSTASDSGSSAVPHAKKAGAAHRISKIRLPNKREAAASQPAQHVAEVLSVSVNISFFRCPADFYIQMKARESDLESLMEQLKMYEAAASTEREWKVGDYCAAKSAQDGLWYRGQVHGVGEDGVCKVHFVDFGFQEMLPMEAIHPLKKKYGDHECFAEHCYLADLLPAGSTDHTKWSQTCIEFVIQQLKGKELFVKLEGERVGEFGLPVDILIEETIPETPFDPPRHEYVSLNAMLLDKGLALPTKCQRTPDPATQRRVDPFQTKVKATAECEEEEEKTLIAEEIDDVLKDVIIVQQDLDVPPHDPPTSSILTLIPVYVDDDGVFYAHDVDEEATITAFFKRIDCYVRMEAPQGLLEVRVGQICLAHFAVDNVWYRARVLEVNKDSYKVKYIDFGNTSVVLSSQLKLATPELCRTPQLAYQMVLHNLRPDTDDGTWPVSSLDYMHSQIVNFQCTIEVKSDMSSVPLEVDILLSDGRNLSGTLMAMGVALPKNDMEKFYQRSADITHILQHSNPYFPLSLGEVDAMKYVLVTHIELPNLVYLQRSPQEPNTSMSEQELKDLAADKDSLDEFVQLMDALNKLPPQTPALGEVPAAGEMCSAKYSDNRWYRGLVAKASRVTKTALIFYVDYGNSEEVPLQRLRVLPARFQKMPAQAVRAHLNVGPPAGKERWTLEDFTAMADSIYLMHHAALIKNTEPLTVELFPDIPYNGIARLSYEQLITSGVVVRAAGFIAPDQHDIGVLIESDSSEEEATVPV